LTRLNGRKVTFPKGIGTEKISEASKIRQWKRQIGGGLPGVSQTQKRCRGEEVMGLLIKFPEQKGFKQSRKKSLDGRAA